MRAGRITESTSPSSTNLAQIAHHLKSAEHIAIVIHQQPDGDAIGSAAALYFALSPTKRVEVVCSTQVPAVFNRLVGDLPVVQSLPSKAQLIVVLDCADSHRTGFAYQLKKSRQNDVTVIAIDHHPANNLAKLVNQYFCDVTASSTAQLINDCLRELNQPVTPQIANALLMGVYTDTGGFQHPNTTSQVLQLASRLIRLGANLQRISQAFTSQFSLSKKRLWGIALSQAQLSSWGVLIARISRNDLQEAKATVEDALGLANYLALANESKAALVLIETENGWRGTLRSRHRQVDLGRLARYLGGRGHKKAAGFIATKDIFSGKIDKE